MTEENSNVSQYPFTAYVADASDLMEGYVELQMSTQSSGSTIYLENYLLRTDESGKTYVYAEGEDGLLEKRYVTTGASLWGTATQVTGGLSSSDHIAFPYGNDVKEGAKTTEVDYFDDSIYG